MRSNDVLNTYYSEPKEDGSFAIIMAKTLSEALQELAQQVEVEKGCKVDPSSFTLTTTNPSKPRILTFTPSSAGKRSL